MSTEEPKPGSSTASDSKVEPSAADPGAKDSPAAPGNVDAAVAWPPPEAAPSDNGEAPAPEAASSASAAESAAESATNNGEAKPDDSGVMTAPAQPAKPPAAADEIPAATPQEEMGLSNSTLHWLEDGDQAVPGRLTEPGSMASYDPRAPVPGRRRAVLVVGLAGAVALIVAGTLFLNAQKRRAAEPPAPTAIEPARDLTNRAEAALAANKIDDALELAHLALVADPRFADAHFVVAVCKKARNQNSEARDEFRKYLELAPLGTHAADARTALTTLPP
jgi:hypothetical protein